MLLDPESCGSKEVIVREVESLDGTGSILIQLDFGPYTRNSLDNF